MKKILRLLTSETTKKSMKLRCTGASTTGPVAGTLSAPSTSTRQ